MTDTLTVTAETPVADATRVERAPLHRSIMKTVQAVVVGFVAFMLLGNLLILVMHAVARTTAPLAPAAVQGVEKLQAIDDRVWRGSAPTREGYAGLAAAGVETIVDLRAEDHVNIDEALMEDLDVRLVRMPVRDGQIPTAAQVNAFLGIVDSADGLVYVHCGAGVGRTGSMSAAYLTATGQGNGWEALRRNLAVGPPSLEQVAYVARMNGHSYQKPRPLIVGMSRVLDAPRRIWSRVGF